MKVSAIITVTFPSHCSVVDNRPGHTVEGMLWCLDPFQRKELVRAERVGATLADRARYE